MIFRSLVATTVLLAPSVASAGPSAGGDVEISAEGGKGKGRAKGAKKKRELSEEEREEREKPWIERWGPENNQLDLGIYMGAFILGSNHGLFDRGRGTQPQVRRSAFDLGFRATYWPLKYIGVGFGTSVMPTRSEQLNVRANIFTVRGHVVGQGPWRITPTLTLGGGLLGINSSNARLKASDGAFHWGPGIKFFVFKWLAVRLDGRHIVTPDGVDARRVHHGEILVGVETTLRFRRISNRPRRFDGDLDGVLDEFDECPDEKGVEPHGCPAEKDSDKDGIPDARDRCPKEWGDTPSGCPIPDKDQDGVLDSVDNCPDEPETNNGFSDEDGCPDEEPQELKEFTGVIKGIKFASGRDTVRSQSHKLLNRAAKVLQQYPQVRLEIIGHTDAQGGRQSNMDLSERRAKAVRDYLVGKGIDASRFEVRGAGPDEPIADNKTRSGRAENRRIEFKLLQAGAGSGSQ